MIAPSYRTDRRTLLGCALVALLVGFGWASHERSAAKGAEGSDTTARVSIGSDGTQANGESSHPALSADGRYVAFDSAADNLVAGDTNGAQDIFVHDRQTGETRRVSVARNGSQGDGDSSHPVISADGRYVAFVSAAANLVADDTNGREDIFVHDRQHHRTVRVSVTDAGSQGVDWGGAANPAIAANGRFVAFDMDGTLTDDDSSNWRDVFVHDRDVSGDGVFDEAGDIRTVRVSVATNGSEGNYHSEAPDLSDDGRFVVFESGATNLAPDKTAYTLDVFLHDRDTDEDGVFDEAGAISTVRISQGRDNKEADAPSEQPALSGDGRFAVFASRATNLLAGAPLPQTLPLRSHIYVYARKTGNTVILDRTVDASSPGAGSSNWPMISTDGRYVAFESGADNLVAHDTNYANDVFLVDRDVDRNGVFDEPGQWFIQRVSLAANGGQALVGARAPAPLTADGRVIAFQSFSADLVADDTNDTFDVFVRVRRNRPPVAMPDWLELSVGQNAHPINVVNNDYDPDGDPMALAAVGPPKHGTTSIENDSTTVLYRQAISPASTDWFTYTISDGTLQAIGSVGVTNCRAGCVFGLLWRGNCDDTSAAAQSASAASPASGRRTAQAPAFDIDVYYRVRDEVLAATPAGQRYIDLFYAHNTQIVYHLLTVPSLWHPALNVLDSWQPALQALVDGQGQSTPLTQAQIQTLDDFLSDLAAVADDDLRQVIADERTRIGPLDNYVGTDIETARGALVGHAIYLPWVASAPDREAMALDTLALGQPLRQRSAVVAPGVTYYVRPDGGSTGQCTGLADAAYPGSGVNQPCAWDHPFRALPPDGAPRIAGGDTLRIAAGSYRMGYAAPGADACDAGGAYGCHMPPIPSGPDPAHPTRILGDSQHPPELWGAERPWFIVNLSDASNVEIGYLEITDHSGCVEFHSGGLACARDNPPYGDWAGYGLHAEDSANVYLHHLNIHGLAAGGVHAGRLTDWTVEDVRIAGNGSVGWDGDLWDEFGDANAGALTFRRWTVEWNGCGETWPGGQPAGCWGQSAGGYGDGVATGESGGHWVIEDSLIRYNTSDGLDFLYIRAPGSSIEIRRTRVEGNAGNQVKNHRGPFMLENSILVGNCAFFAGQPFTHNVDHCRALGDALALGLTAGDQVTVTNNTFTSEGDCLVTAECYGGCNGSERARLRNNIFQGQTDFLQPDERTCLVYQETFPASPFDVDYSLVNGVKDDLCPGAHDICGAGPGLANAGVDGFDAHLLPGSAAIDAGLPGAAPSDDFDGRARDAQPDIGAYEYAPGGPTLTPTPTPTNDGGQTTPTVTPTPSATLRASATPTAGATPTSTPTPTASARRHNLPLILRAAASTVTPAAAMRTPTPTATATSLSGSSRFRRSQRRA